MTEHRATLLLAARLVLPALAGIAITIGLGGIDIGEARGQRAALVAIAVSAGLAWIVAIRAHKRLAASLIDEARAAVAQTDLETGLGNRAGLLALLGSDLRGINTLVVFESDDADFAELLREATRPEQDRLFHLQGPRYAALLTNTSPADAEVVVARLGTRAGKARMRQGESAEAWLERSCSELADAG